MSEWWTYRVSDFLMFSSPTYDRLLALHNLALWPAQVPAFGLGLAILALLRRGGPRRGRIIAALLAAAWLWVAWAFHLRRYATINWAAVHFAAAFALEAALILWAGVVRDRLLPGPGRAGLAVFLAGLLAYPLVTPLLGRQWNQMELFAVVPDPTVVATLGVLLLASPRAPRLLLVVPVLWCAVTGATLWAMDSPEAPIAPLAAVLTLLRLKGRR